MRGAVRLEEGPLRNGEAHSEMRGQGKKWMDKSEMGDTIRNVGGWKQWRNTVRHRGAQREIKW